MIVKVEEREKFTKYEVARILGARALQISMDAPLLLKIEKEKIEQVNYDPLKIAEIEFSAGVLPITVKRPFPKKLETKLKREMEIVEKKEEEVEKLEKKEEAEIKEEGEIMELVKPDDEFEEAEEEGEEEAI